MEWVSRNRAKLWLLLALAIIAAIHVLAISSTRIADDVYFAAALNGQSLGEFLAFRYEHWSGRLPIELLLVLVVQHSWLWKLINTMMVLLLCYSSGRAVRVGASVSASTLLAFVLLMLVSPAVLYESTWWMTGSVNYLWPAALGLYGLLAFLETTPHSSVQRMGFLLASGFAVYNEQLALVLLPVTLCLMFVKWGERRWNTWDIVHLAFMVANAWVAFSAPGTHNRYLAEQALRFPNYADLEMLDKAAIGFGLVFKSTIDPGNFLVALLVLLAFILTLRSPIGKPAKVTLLASLSFLALNYMLALPVLEDSGMRRFYGLPPVGGGSASSSRLYILCAWSAFTIASLVIASASAFWRSRQELMLVTLTLIMGLASLSALGFSPTAYASGWRIHFVCQLAYLLVVMRLLSRIREEFGTRPYSCALAIISLLSAYRIVQLLLH